jgi:DNA-binding SARP family transcriptional activator
VLELKVLGGLAVHRDGRALSGALAQPRRLAILALLARGGQGGVPRDRLISTLWPDVEEERARHTFNQTLYAIRREIGDDEVIIGMRELRLNTEILSVDALELQAAIAEGNLQRAVDLYDGPFLDGFHLPGSDEFERWVERERGLIERTYTNALEQLARDATAREDHARAVTSWRTRAARDPLDARIAVALMQALAAAGERLAAIQHARVYEVLIAEELSLPPDRDVVRLAEELRREQVAEAAAAAEPPAPSRPELTIAAIPSEEVRTSEMDAPAGETPVDVDETAAPVSQASSVLRLHTRLLRRRSAWLVAASLAGAAALGALAARDGNTVADTTARVIAIGRGALLDSTGAVTTVVLAVADSGTLRRIADLGVPATPNHAAVATTRSPTAYRMYERGLEAHYRGERTVARTFFDAAVAEDSQFALAQYYAAIDATDPTEGRRGLERARRLASTVSDRERLRIMAGWANAMSAPSFRAIAETLAVRYPTEVAGHLNLGMALVSDGEYLAALGPLGRVLEMDSLGLRGAAPDCAACEALRSMVGAYEFADSLAAAERVARRWVRLQPHSRVAMHTLIEVLDAQGRGPEADSLLRAKDPRLIEHADALNRRAAYLLRAGDYGAADRLLTTVVEAGGVHEQIDAYWMLAINLRQQGRLAEALGATRRMRAITPHTGQAIPGAAPPIAVLEAQVLLELGRPRAGAALFDSIARAREQLDSDATAARRATWHLTHSAGARAAAGDTAALARLIDSVQSLGLRSGIGRDRRLHHYVRGLMLVARGNDVGAAVELRRSILSQNFGYTRANYELARALMRLGRPAEAVAVLRPALRGGVEASNLYVTRTELHELLAQAWEATGARDSAAAHYRIVAGAWARADPALRERQTLAGARAAALSGRRTELALGR